MTKQTSTTWQERFDSFVQKTLEQDDSKMSGNVYEDIESYVATERDIVRKEEQQKMAKLASEIDNKITKLDKQFATERIAIRADERRKVNDEWMYQKANDHDARIRAEERREILELLKKVEAEQWKDAEHCSCLIYAIDKLEKRGEK